MQIPQRENATTWRALKMFTFVEVRGAHGLSRVDLPRVFRSGQLLQFCGQLWIQQTRTLLNITQDRLSNRRN